MPVVCSSTALVQGNRYATLGGRTSSARWQDFPQALRSSCHQSSNETNEKQFQSIVWAFDVIARRLMVADRSGVLMKDIYQSDGSVPHEN